MFRSRSWSAVLAAGVSLLFGLLPGPVGAAAAPSVPRYDHVFLVIFENHGFSQIIGNAAAPNYNALAKTYGLATKSYSTGDPSETNYVAMLGGSNFNLATDAPYWDNRISGPSLISELDQASISWKAYLQGLPYPGYRGTSYPPRINGTPDTGALYDSKHNGIPNFSTSLNDADWSRQVPDTQLASDLASGTVPTFGYVVPDVCHDMHGSPPMCLDSGSAITAGQPIDPQDQLLVAQGDAYLGGLVHSITSASFWGTGNNAIVLTFDQGADLDVTGCCDASPGTGRIATVVVTSHGPRAFQDPTPYNHFSVLQTLQDGWGLPCLQFTCDTAHMTPMAPLLRVTGSPAVAYTALPETAVHPPNAVAKETQTQVTPPKPGKTGFVNQTSAELGTSDNDLGGISAASATDVWAVGSFLPDDPKVNPDSIETLTEHFNGTRWSDVASPNVGTNFNVLYGISALPGRAWTVGDYLNSDFTTVGGLIESWNGTAWSVVTHPQPGSMRNGLYGVAAVSPTDVWAVGDEQGVDGKFNTVAEHWDGTAWTVVPTANPGSAGNHLYAVAASASNDVWAVGEQLGPTWPDSALVEHWDGSTWSAVTLPTIPGSPLLSGVAVSGGTVWAVGTTYDSTTLQQTVAITGNLSGWQVVSSPNVAAQDSYFYGVTVAAGQGWAVGTSYDPATDLNHTLAAGGTSSGMTVVPSDHPGLFPLPATPANPPDVDQLGGVTSVGNMLLAAGMYGNGNADQGLIQKATATPPTCSPNMAAPTGITVTAGAAGSGQATVTWTPPGPDCAGPPLAYDVYLYGSDGSNQTQVVTSPSSMASGLTAGVFYTATVIAWDGSKWNTWGAWAPWSMEN